jgi:hypothetical protein
MQFEARTVIHFLHLRQKTDKEIYNELVIVYGPEVLCPMTVRY